MNKLVEVALVLGGGAIGGVLSVVDAWADPVSYPLTLSKLATLLVIPLLKGGIAAGIGVYLLTTLDSAQLVRAFFFAVTCGLTFPTILTSGTVLANKATSQVAAKEIASNVEALKAATASVAASGVNRPTAEVVSTIQEASLAIIQATPKVASSEAKAADAVVQQAVTALAQAASSPSAGVAVDAISGIGEAAAVRSLPRTQERATLELRALKAASLPEGLRERAAIGLTRVENAALQR